MPSPPKPCLATTRHYSSPAGPARATFRVPPRLAPTTTLPFPRQAEPTLPTTQLYQARAVRLLNPTHCPPTDWPGLPIPAPAPPNDEPSHRRPSPPPPHDWPKQPNPAPPKRRLEPCPRISSRTNRLALTSHSDPNDYPRLAVTAPTNRPPWSGQLGSNHLIRRAMPSLHNPSDCPGYATPSLSVRLPCLPRPQPSDKPNPTTSGDMPSLLTARHAGPADVPPLISSCQTTIRPTSGPTLLTSPANARPAYRLAFSSHHQPSRTTSQVPSTQPMTFHATRRARLFRTTGRPRPALNWPCDYPRRASPHLTTGRLHTGPAPMTSHAEPIPFKPNDRPNRPVLPPTTPADMPSPSNPTPSIPNDRPELS